MQFHSFWCRRPTPIIALVGLSLGFVSGALAQGAGPAAWSDAAPLPEPIGEIVGANIAGKLYVLSGLDDKTYGPDGVVWEYDPAGKAWTAKKKMPAPAHHIMTAALDGKLYVFGGFKLPTTVRAWQPTNGAWAYDPSSDSWKELAPMPTPRGAGQAVAVGGKIYVIGGANSNQPGHLDAPLMPRDAQTVVGTVEAYDPAINTWESRAPMPTPRNHYLAAAVGGKIYAIDGRIGSVFVTMSDVIDVVEEYDPATNHWKYKGRSPTNRGDVSGGVYNGKIYVAGGEFQDTMRKMAFWGVEVYDPQTETWEAIPHMQIARHGFAAAFLGNVFHVMGGSFQSDGMPGISSQMATHEVFEVKTAPAMDMSRNK
jgi:N-acetylneuraminic acid mutarotase